MLRIGVRSNSQELQFVLEGELVEPWVSELKFVWEREGRNGQNRKYVVDLSEVTRIDENGKSILRAMKEEGVRLVASGVSTKYLIRGLGKRDS